jgi:hypothetical protein
VEWFHGHQAKKGLNVTEQAFTIEQFIGAFKVGRTKAYEEIASGRLSTYKVGRRRYISAHAAAEWQRRMEQETAVPVESDYRLLVV